MNILFVCTGNICRSPLGEQALMQLLENQSSPEAAAIQSAGTHAMVGAPMDQGSLVALTDLGLTPREHRAQQVTRELTEWANLVLTFEEQQRTDVVELLPRANKYTFTVLEFANLLQHYEGEPGDGNRLADVLVHRGMVPQLAKLDIADPYGKDSPAFTAMAQQTMAALQVIAGWLCKS